MIRESVKQFSENIMLKQISPGFGSRQPGTSGRELPIGEPFRIP
jgi:hypothetical protein